LFRRLRSLDIAIGTQGEEPGTVDKALTYAPLIVGSSLESITITGKRHVSGDLIQLYFSTVVDASCPVARPGGCHPNEPL
jgi:hypothetical protein